MKKTLSLVLCLVLAVSMLAGCTSPQETPTTDPVETTPAGDTDTLTIGVTYCLLSAPAVAVFAKGIQETAQVANVEIIEVDAEWDATKQADQIDTFISQGVDAILLNPVDASALIPAAKRAHEAGIPVICGAMNLDESGQEFVTSYVGADDADIGYQAGLLMNETLSSGDKVAVIEGSAGASASVQRNEGFEKAIGEGELEIIGSFAGNFETAAAMTATEDLLTKNPDIKGIFVHDDTMAIGVVQAMKALGYTGDDITVISYNGSANGAEMIKNGEILASAVQPLYAEGQISLETSVKAANGETVEKWYKDEINMLDQNNVETYDSSLLW